MNAIKTFLSKHLLFLGVFLLTFKTIVVSLVGFSLPFQTVTDYFLLLLAPLGSILLLLGCSFFFSRNVRPLVFLVVYVLCTALLIGNLLYYRFYIDFLTASVFMQFSNVGGLGSSTVELFSPYDLLLIIDVLLFTWFLVDAKKQRISIKRPKRKVYGITATSLFVASLGISHLQNPYLLHTDYARDQLVSSIGIYNYQVVNLVHSVRAPAKEMFANQSIASEVTAGMEEPSAPDREVFGMAAGKNVILISLESTQQFVINKTIDGEELTPFLNEFIKESFYFPNIYDQTAQGKSSDMEFMLDTGFYPLSSGSAFVRRYTNTYKSIPSLLESKSYTSAVFHANDATFWNRELMYDALGYHHFFSKEYYDISDELSVNYGLKDKPFFEQSIPLLQKIEQPFMAKFITLTNHFPFLLDEEDQLIEPGNTGVGVVDRYLTTVRYQDAAVEQFVSRLKEEGLYENTMFVLYGDHYGISRQYENGVHNLLNQEETTLSHIDLQKIPLIIHIPGQTGQTIKTEGGQIDIHSTLLHLLGLSTEDNLTFSHDLFTRSAEVPVIFRDGRFVSHEYVYADHSCIERSSGNIVDDASCAVDQELVREQLNLSDEFLLGDLLRFID
ncbi:LTA synthase family protein [Shouchella patagoniensis]|uniref:LTA synthase family protein n=1 Tax=Shouchella patagoniensis TaxID=228576 RepID=UPI000995DE1A|nr:LTA synthase family protein [Shouchella patagoniensis]